MFRVEPGDLHPRIISWSPDLTPEILRAQKLIADELKRVTGVDVVIPGYAGTPLAGDIYLTTQPWDAPGA